MNNWDIDRLPTPLGAQPGLYGMQSGHKLILVDNHGSTWIGTVSGQETVRLSRSVRQYGVDWPKLAKLDEATDGHDSRWAEFLKAIAARKQLNLRTWGEGNDGISDDVRSVEDVSQRERQKIA